MENQPPRLGYRGRYPKADLRTGLQMRDRLFRGELPPALDERWDCIYRFVEHWCTPKGKAFNRYESIDTLESVDYAKNFYSDELSTSIQNWMGLVEHSAEHGIPGLRDHTMLVPLEEHFSGVTAGEYLVLLMQGESDVFWSIHVDDISAADPPVIILCQTEEPRPEILGHIDSVSEFVIGHLFWYNTYSANCSKWFPADLDAEETRNMSVWMERTLRIHDGSHPRSFWENEWAGAIVNGERWEMSMFLDPAQIDMPDFLTQKLQEHQELSKKMFP